MGASSSSDPHGAPRRGCPSTRSEFAVCACWARTSTPCEARCARAEADSHRELADEFLSALADGTVSVDDLLGPAADPREADLLYRRLAQDPNLVGAHFDWTRLPESEALGRAHLWRPPDVRGRRLEASRPLRPGANGRAPSALALADDPFAGAVGRLRIGLLGCGDIARLNAAAVVAAPNAELTACFDPAPALAREIADRHGAQVTESAEELVEHPDVDAVFVCVPHPPPRPACHAGGRGRTARHRREATGPHARCRTDDGVGGRAGRRDAYRVLPEPLRPTRRARASPDRRGRARRPGRSRSPFLPRPVGRILGRRLLGALPSTWRSSRAQ